MLRTTLTLRSGRGAVRALLDAERARQSRSLELIASENSVPEHTRAALASVASQKVTI